MLIQLIGPEGCGKSELRRRLCPDAVNIDYALGSRFWNSEMIEASGFYFEEVINRWCLDKLEAWMCELTIDVHMKGSPVITIKNPGIWIYEGLRPIQVEPTMIWRVDHGRS